ncbi:hypothetical protein CEXT_150051 [Caerostris extrusa]|uniref:Uncharacterized protein n=1 Tax=Caerostris extrusa TaxID=172846 RepID=A0AAV4ULK7_CAEEX|nr:hypothetical protein CEXT_150051 [Caerostris extrusa]
MSLIHRFLYTLRTLTEEEPQHPQRRRKRDRTAQRSSSTHHQAVALVITFRDLFTSGGLNVLLEDMEMNRSTKKIKSGKSNTTTANATSEVTCQSFCENRKLEVSQTLSKALENAERDLIDLESDLRGDAVRVLHEERLISTPKLPNTSRFEGITDLLVPVTPESSALEVYGPNRRSKKYRSLTVPLSSEDENKTVDVLRKALKWSPRKQSVAKFAVQLPNEEEYKAVAVVQNAVNRVKEEQQQKRRRKFRFFKLKFC